MRVKEYLKNHQRYDVQADKARKKKIRYMSDEFQNRKGAVVNMEIVYLKDGVYALHLDGEKIMEGSFEECIQEYEERCGDDER